MVKVTFYVQKSVIDRLKLEAKQREIGYSEYLRRILDSEFAKIYDKKGGKNA